MYTLGFSQRAKTIFAGAIIGLFLSKGLALIPGFGLDDYLDMNQGRNPLLFFGYGRYTDVAIQVIINSLGVTSTSIGWFSAILCFVAVASSITAGIIFATRSKGPVMVQAGVAAIIGSHPYFTELFSYRGEGLTFIGISFVILLFVFAIIFNLERTDQRIGFSKGILLLTIPLLALVGTRQTPFLIALMFIISRFAIDSMAIGGIKGIRRSFHHNSALLITFLLSGIIYFIIVVLTQKILGAQHDPRASMLSIADTSTRIKEISLLLKHILWDNEVILSQFTKILLLVAIVGMMTTIALTDIKVAIGCFLLFVALSLCGIFLVSISAVWWPVPRAIFGIGFSFGLILIAMSIWFDKGQKLVLGLILTITIGQILHSNTMLHDQLRINRWDLWTAGAIAQDLAAKGVKQDKKVYLIDPDMVYPAGPKTAIGDLNVSALSTTGYAKYLMKEATGREWDIESVAGTPEVCPRDFPLWPSPDSIRIFTERVFVCMGHPKE